MNSPPHRPVDNAALEQVLTAAGVEVTGADVEAVARSFARIQAAADALMPSLPFDETGERFYRLLDTGSEAGR